MCEWASWLMMDSRCNVDDSKDMSYQLSRLLLGGEVIENYGFDCMIFLQTVTMR